jgi:excisionase family DNA binding protein
MRTEEIEPMLITIKKASETIGLSERQVRHLLDERRLRFVKIGARIMIPREALAEFVQSMLCPHA